MSNLTFLGTNQRLATIWGKQLNIGKNNQLSTVLTCPVPSSSELNHVLEKHPWNQAAVKIRGLIVTEGAKIDLTYSKSLIIWFFKYFYFIFIFILSIIIILSDSLQKYSFSGLPELFSHSEHTQWEKSQLQGIRWNILSII